METTGAARRSFARHDAFEERDEACFELTTTAFDAVATVDEGAVRVIVTVPTLDGATQDAVDAVVEDGWVDTFERRVTDPTSATRTDAVDTEVEREADAIHVRLAIEAPPDQAAAEAKAVADFVEGTWVQGAVPGYEYAPPASGLLARARERGAVGGGVAADE